MKKILTLFLIFFFTVSNYGAYGFEENIKTIESKIIITNNRLLK